MKRDERFTVRVQYPVGDTEVCVLVEGHYRHTPATYGDPAEEDISVQSATVELPPEEAKDALQDILRMQALNSMEAGGDRGGPVSQLLYECLEFKWNGTPEQTLLVLQSFIDKDSGWLAEKLSELAATNELF